MIVCSLQVAGCCINQIKYRNPDSSSKRTGTINPFSKRVWQDISEEDMKKFEGFWVECAKTNLLEKFKYVLALVLKISHFRQQNNIFNIKLGKIPNNW